MTISARGSSCCGRNNGLYIGRIGNMDSREFLEQVWALQTSINGRLEQVPQLRRLADSISSCISPEGSVMHTRDVTALQSAIARVVDEENKLAEELRRLEKLKEIVKYSISLVGNQYQRELLEKRYLFFKPWQLIAREMNFSLRWVYSAHRAALRSMQQILDEGKLDSVLLMLDQVGVLRDGELSDF